MRVWFGTAIVCFLITGCNSNEKQASSNSTTPNSATVASSPTTLPTGPSPSFKSKLDACKLLTSEDIKGVQGETYTNAVRSEQGDGDFMVVQCYFALPTAANSIVLNVTMAKEGAGAQSPRAFWQTTFGREEGEKKNKAAQPSQEQEQEAAKPERIGDLGEEAFWTASRVSGALYVLKKDLFFRISVGGASDEKTKLEKSKKLAQIVLKRL